MIVLKCVIHTLSLSNDRHELINYQFIPDKL